MRPFLIFLALVSSAFAEHIYLNQSGTGDGTSAAQAKALYAFWNNPGNWSTAVNTTDSKIGPGDTVHIVGVVNAAGSSASAANQLTWQGSGTPGNPITLKFDVGGQIRHPHSFGTGLVYSGGGLHDIIIEGANGTVAMNTGAFVQKDIEIYDNGTNFTYHITGTYAVSITGAGDNITVKNLYMFGGYQREKNNTTDTAGDGNLASVRGQNNLVYDNCRADFGEGGLGLSSQGNTTGFRITNNYVYGCSTAIKLGTALGFVNEGAVITGNVMDGFAYWAGLPAPNQHHCDGFQTITPGGGLSIGNGEHRNYTVAYNRIGPDLGLYGSMNAHIYMEDNINGAKIYNNLLLANSTPTNPAQGNVPPGTANGFITGGTYPQYFSIPTAIRSLVVNNTIIGGGSGAGIATSFAECRGNIIVNVSTMIRSWQQQPPNAAHGQYLISQDNVFYHPSGTYGFGMVKFSDGQTLTCNDFACWKSHPNIIAQNGGVGFDLNSKTENPLVTFPTGVITSVSSPAVGFAPTQTVFSNDFYGTTRSVPWDCGAVEFAAGGAPPPTIVSSAINAAGTQFAIVMSETSVFGAGGNGGMVVSASSGTVTLGTPSIAGTTITWPITNRLIGQTETLTRSYTQPGNGIEATDDGQDLNSVSSVAVTNNSTVSQAALPQFVPLPGTYTFTQNVAITTTTPSGSVRYTIDGSDPTSSSTLYTGPISTSVNTTYKAKAFAGGFLDSSVATGVYQIGDFVITNSWFNVPVTTQTGTVTWSFRASTSVSPTDAVMGFSDNTVNMYSHLAAIVRFNDLGFIDAYNGGISDYAALNSFPYVAGQTYDFVFTINIPAHTYSVTVVQTGGGTPTSILTNVAFRSQSASVVELDNFAGLAQIGAVTVSNMTFNTTPPGTGIGTLNVQNLRIGP